MLKRVLLITIAVVLAFPFIVQAEMPQNVQKQSRKGVVPPDDWKKFDKSGQVRFLQIQTTAPHSEAGKGAALDGSAGEMLIEIHVDPAVKAAEVDWSLKNKGKSPIWVLAAGGADAGLPIKIESKATVTLKTTLDKDHYTYIVVDNEGGGKTSLDVKAKCGDVDAKTARGKSMLIIWF